MRLLTEGGYVHYRWKEDDELHAVMAGILKEFGSIGDMVKGAGSAGELRHRLEVPRHWTGNGRYFHGMGARTVQRNLHRLTLPGAFGLPGT